MPQPTGKRPSKDPEELAQQLRAELDRLTGRDGEEGGMPLAGSEGSGAVTAEPWQYRKYLWQLVADAWHQVSRGDLRALGRTLGHLSSAASAFVEDHLPEEADPRIEAAREIHLVMELLHVGEEATDLPRFEERLRVPAVTEREVLNVLLDAKGDYLRRGEIFERMPAGHSRPTPARVSQILADLHVRGLVLRMYGRAQGAEQVAFFALSENGAEVCRRVGMGGRQARLPESSRPVSAPRLPRLGRLRPRRRSSWSETVVPYVATNRPRTASSDRAASSSRRRPPEVDRRFPRETEEAAARLHILPGDGEGTGVVAGVGPPDHRQATDEQVSREEAHARRLLRKAVENLRFAPTVARRTIAAGIIQNIQEPYAILAAGFVEQAWADRPRDRLVDETLRVLQQRIDARRSSRPPPSP
jgi:hypothetical protein